MKTVPPDPRLVEAQQAFDEGKRLSEAGRYAEAVPLIQSALELRERALTQSHPKVADCLVLLGRLYFVRADFARAEPLLARALEIRKAALGENHPDIADVLNDLANLYLKQGLYSRAEHSYERALEILEATLGQSDPKVALVLNNLAYLYLSQRLYTCAEPLLERAVMIWDATLGAGSLPRAYSDGLVAQPSPPITLANALPLYARALRLQEDATRLPPPALATLLNNLASFYREQGLSAPADLLYLRALEIWEDTRGVNHPDVTQSLHNLARFRLGQQNLGAALPLLERALTASEQHLRQEVFGLSDRSLTSFLELLRSTENLLYALAAAHPGNARVVHLALCAALLRKGRSVQEVANTSLLISRGLGPEDLQAFERLRGLRAQLATLWLTGPGKRSPADNQRLEELEAESDRLEADLARRSAPLRALTMLPSPAGIVEQVAQALPRDSALVELIGYEDEPFISRPGTPESEFQGELRYLALVLLPGSGIRAVDLGPAAPIDQAASNLRDALARRDATFQASARALYRLAFKPLLPLLGSTRRLIISPDGQFNLVPFAALHDGRKFLLDAFDFSYVTSGKDLLPRPADLVPSNSFVVLADPDFSALPPASAPAQADAPGLARRSAPIAHFFSTLQAALARQSWVPLPGTRQEAKALQRLVPRAQLFLGSNATKERLLHLPTPGVLHLATHGFFLGDTLASQASRAAVGFGALGDGEPTELPADPLLRSGLALAGAAALAPASSSPATSPRDNALITALELAGLNLWGTELVVLSACDTGRGDITLGQGVYGLRRALIVAGAETVVMSLWKVNDDSTRVLMEAYYRNLLAGQSRASALHEAMRSLRVSRPHPHYWAPFIAVGRDGPLRSLNASP